MLLLLHHGSSNPKISWKIITIIGDDNDDEDDGACNVDDDGADNADDADINTASKWLAPPLGWAAISPGNDITLGHNGNQRCAHSIH